jgi:transaldolase
MRLYLDTANVKEILDAASLGMLDGVTTNPSLVAKEGRAFREALVEICNIVDGPINAEVVDLGLNKFLAGWNAQLQNS